MPWGMLQFFLQRPDLHQIDFRLDFDTAFQIKAVANPAHFQIINLRYLAVAEDRQLRMV